MFGFISELFRSNPEVVKTACQKLGEQLGENINFSQVNLTDLATRACELGEEYGVNLYDQNHQLAIGVAALTTAATASTVLAYGLSRLCRRAPAAHKNVDVQVSHLAASVEDVQFPADVAGPSTPKAVPVAIPVGAPEVAPKPKKVVDEQPVVATLDMDAICNAYLAPEAKKIMRKKFAAEATRGEIAEHIRVQLEIPEGWKVDRSNDVLVRKVNAQLDHLNLRDHRLTHVDLRANAVSLAENQKPKKK